MPRSKKKKPPSRPPPKVPPPGHPMYKLQSSPFLSQSKEQTESYQSQIISRAVSSGQGYGINLYSILFYYLLFYFISFRIILFIFYSILFNSTSLYLFVIRYEIIEKSVTDKHKTNRQTNRQTDRQTYTQECL